ncbi:MAG: hypothetical protein QOI20_788 [Acidimicrobiaceae bacterium]|jgi:hypothetical protein|nr:hypothetical protein [Acidimicrobiaceae bacterium]
MANKQAVGMQGPAFDMAVERGKVREFARATKSEHADYLQDPQPPIPPTFLTTSTFWQPPEAAALWRELDIDVRRLLHGEQEYVFPTGPPRAGATLTAKTRVESVFEKEGKRGGTMTFVVTVTDFTDERGDVVAQARSTAIETGRPPA